MGTLNPTVATSGVLLRHGLQTTSAASATIALLMATAAALGLLQRYDVYPTAELRLAFVPSDLFHLIVGLPILLISVWLTRRGHLVGLLCWPGALLYVLYMYVPYLIAVPVTPLLPLYLMLVILSAITLIGLVTNMDSEAVRQRIKKHAPARLCGGILIALAVLIVLRQGVAIFTAISTPSPVDMLEVATVIADSAVAVPAFLGTGILLWQRRPLGYATGAGMLLAYGLLALSVVPFLILEAQTVGAPLDVVGIVVLLVMSAVCLIPFAFFVRVAASAHKN